MSKRIYVGNLPYETSGSDLEQAFARFGKVSNARIVTDRETGRSRGFGFVEMDEAGASWAISELDQTEFGGRTIVVNEARERAGGGGHGGGRSRQRSHR